MGLDAASAIAVGAAVALAALIVAIIVAASAGACGGGGRRGPGGAAVHDVERALGAATLVTYDQARAAGPGTGKSGAGGRAPPPDADEAAGPCCAFCLSEFAGGADELVRVVSACGHFFHAECGVDGWLRARGTCPLCRAEVWTLPRPPRPECPQLPPRSGGATVAVASRY